MEWTQFLLLFITIAGMMYSIKADAREDRTRSSDDRKDIISMMRNSELEAKEFRIQTTNEFKEFREHTSTEFKEFREQISNIQKQIANEAKEFHGRLCTIEERYLQIITGKKKKGE